MASDEPGAEARSNLLGSEIDEDYYDQEHSHHVSDASSSLDQDRHLEDTVSPWYLLVLTCGVAGLQVVWSVILSNGAPFLVSLGLSKSLTALVWVAAPLCGMLIQPLVGILSDRSRHTWGRRRPFIIVGTIGVIISMIALAWVKVIIEGLALALGGNPHHIAVQIFVVVLAAIWIYALNISIQPLQAGLRALIVENCPAHQQNQASAWASAMVGAGNIVGYFSGFIQLPELFDSTTLTQFQGLCLIASLALLITIPINCYWVVEKSPSNKSLSSLERAGLAGVLRDLSRTYKVLPIKIRKVFHIQFCAWIGWFPFLFYSTTYVGEHYDKSVMTKGQPAIHAPEQRKLSEDAIRIGSFASLLFAIVALFANLTVPFLLKSPPKNYETIGGSTLPLSISRIILNRRRFSIRQAWIFAHIISATAMFTTFFVTSQTGAIILVACVGLSWALTLWAPFAIIGAEIAARRRTLGEEGWERSSADGAGAIMGLHNTAISAPQILAALMCSVIFSIVQATGSQGGTAWVLRAGGCATLVAAYLTSTMKD